MNAVNAVNMANMGAMGGPVGAPMSMMNNGAVAPQGAPRQIPVNDNTRALLNTYIYEYFLRFGMFDCARAILNSDQVKVQKDGPGNRRDETGNLLGNGLGDDSMDTDSKDDIDNKRPDDLPAPVVPMPLPDSCFLYEWFCLFWDMFNAQKGKGANGHVNQYVNHTQAQSRIRQAQQQEMLRSMRPEFAHQNQYHLMRNMQQNGAMMGMKQGNNLPRTAMANSQNNPQAMQMLQQKQAQMQGQMQRDPSDMDGNRQRPSSPGSTDNAPSPSKRPRLDGGAFNPNQGGMIPNGRPVGQGMPAQQVGTGPPNPQQVQQLLITNGINPAALNPDQLQTFTNQSPAVQAKTIATYSANMQQQQTNQMHNKPMPNASGPQGQGSPMIPQGPDGAALNAYYNAGEMGAPGAMRPGPGGGQAGGGSNHALQDYQMQLMLLEQQNKKRLMMARQEQDGMGMTRADGGPPGPGGPGAPQGPNAQPFQGTSPQGARTGASPNPADMKRNNQQMGNAGIGSPLPENPQSRGSPSTMNFMGAGAHMDPSGAPNFFKGMNNMEGNMVTAAQMNGMRPHPSPHPGQPPFSGQMNQQQMMAARQQQQQQQQQGGPPMQWQQGGPNGNQMGPQGPQAQQVQTTPQQRSMPPPSAPTAANANQRNQTASPQTSTAAPPTPQPPTKANPKKKETKNAKSKSAPQKKAAANLNAGATPAAEAPADPDVPVPATPITPVAAGSFGKGGQNATVAPVVANGQPAQPPPAPTAVPAPQHTDPNQTSFGMENPNMNFGPLDFADPLTSGDVLNDFDFDSFLHDNNEDPGAFSFDGTFGMEGAGEIGAE